MHPAINSALGTAATGGGEPDAVIYGSNHVAQAGIVLTKLRNGRLIAQTDKKTTSEGVDDEWAFFKVISCGHVNVHEEVLGGE